MSQPTVRRTTVYRPTPSAPVVYGPDWLLHIFGLAPSAVPVASPAPAPAVITRLAA